MSKYQFITKPDNGRRFAIADIHACAKTFKTLVQDKIKLEKEDQLFLLGDYINRGPDSKGVIDFILELQKENFQVFALRGNHEDKFLMAYDCGFEFLLNFLEEYNSLDLINENLSKYINFCSKTEYYIFSGSYFLSHCGIKKGSKTALTDLRLMFNNANLDLEDEISENYFQIHGHKTNDIQNIMKSIKEKHRNINIDAGCVYKDRSNLGLLCALNLDTFELLTQKNIE